MVCVWCDASFDHETKKCGCGIVIKQLISGGVKETRIKVSDYAIDGNDAELKAVLHGVRHVDKPLPVAINIITDSAVTIDLLKKVIYRGNYSLEGVSPKYHATLTRIINELGGERVRLYHVRGHTDKQRKYSEIQAICDKMAREASRGK